MKHQLAKNPKKKTYRKYLWRYKRKRRPKETKKKSSDTSQNNKSMVRIPKLYSLEVRTIIDQLVIINSKLAGLFRAKEVREGEDEQKKATRKPLKKKKRKDLGTRVKRKTRRIRRTMEAG